MTNGAGPMRIAFFGWAWMPLQEAEGTGYNLVQSELAAGLAARGHEVSYLRSGRAYSARPGVYIRRQEVWRGVECHDLFNSPNAASADRNFRNVAAQVHEPIVTKLAVEWALARRAEVAHIHSLEGFGFDLPMALREAGVRVVITPHNYYALCPQVDLMKHERATCVDYEGGRACEGCIPSPDPGWERVWRRLDQSSARVLGVDLPGVRRVLRVHPAPPGGPGAQITVMPGSDGAILAGTGHRVEACEYGRRRSAGVAALSAAHAVLCPGRTLMEVHRAMGVDARVLRHVPIGLPHIDAIRAGVDGAVARAGTGARFVYFGSTKPNKGLRTLCEAFERLEARARGLARLDVFCSGDDGWARERLGAVKGVTFHGAYRTADLVARAGEFDVGIFPNLGLENCPLVLLENLAAGRYVLASDLGASRDWVRPGVTGALFAPGDAGELARRIGAIAMGMEMIPGRSNVREASGVPTFDEFVAGVLGAYAPSQGVSGSSG